MPPTVKKTERSRCMGRSRGGLTTKLHALVDANGLPITLKLTPGQAHDGRSAEDMLHSVEAGGILLADRAYDSDTKASNSAAPGATFSSEPEEVPRLFGLALPPAQRDRALL